MMRLQEIDEGNTQRLRRKLMNKIIKSFISSVAVAAASLMIANSAMAAKTLKIQLAVPTSSPRAPAIFVRLTPIGFDVRGDLLYRL